MFSSYRPCEKFNRQKSIPESIICSSVSALAIVHTIFQEVGIGLGCVANLQNNDDGVMGNDRVPLKMMR